MHDTPINLWQGTQAADTATLIPFPAHGEGRTDIACIVCPGGSYFWLDRGNEGRVTARWLQSRGITAFLLEYRTAGLPAFMTRFRLARHTNRAYRSIHDIFMALNIVKSNAGQWGINPRHIGVLGFSAGGHMVLMAAEKDGCQQLSSLGITPGVTDLSPAFVGAVYPVVSFVDECTHKRSRRGLIGDFNAHHQELRRELSAELHVRADMPPVFLANCDDDTVVDPRNSRLLYEAMQRAGGSCEFHRYATGGHGFGGNEAATSPEAATWKQAFLNFIHAAISRPTARKNA